MCLIEGSAGQATLVLVPRAGTLAVGALPIELRAQGTRTAVDTIVQPDASDAYRGRALALYDTLFNPGVCAAAGVGLIALPDVGQSCDVQTALFAFVWVLAFPPLWAMVRLDGSPRDADPAAGKPVPPGDEISPRVTGSELGKGKVCPRTGKTNLQAAEGVWHALAFAY